MTGAKRADIFRWSELRENERAQITSHLDAAERHLSPFLSDDQPDPLISLGLRIRGAVAGWIVCHRAAPGVARVTSLYVGPELRGAGYGPLLVAESMRRACEAGYPEAVYVCNVRNTPMVRFLKRRLAPCMASMREFRGAEKSLSAAEGGRGAAACRKEPKSRREQPIPLLSWMEGKIADAPDGGRTFFPTDCFRWVARIESEWRTIRAELDALLLHRDAIPNFQDVQDAQRSLTAADEWKTFFFYGYGIKAAKNCSRCPKTARLLNGIPGMKTAMFSILAPGKHIPPHRGPYKGVLRYHLGLIIPEPKSSCRIRVGGETRMWEEGKSLIFDDTHVHEVWNDSNSHRVVLFVDFIRPLPFPLSVLNRFAIWRISKTPFVTNGIDRAQPEMLEQT